MDRSRYPFTQEDATPAEHPEHGKSCPPHRLVPDAVSAHCIDDALWHRGTTRRVGSLANPRYRQPTHGHPYPGRERSSGPRCHAQAHAAGSLARLLAWAEAQAHPVVVPGWTQPHRRSPHYSQGRLSRLPKGCATRRPADSRPSPHPTSLFPYPLAHSTPPAGTETASTAINCYLVATEDAPTEASEDSIQKSLG